MDFTQEKLALLNRSFFAWNHVSEGLCFKAGNVVVKFCLKGENTQGMLSFLTSYFRPFIVSNESEIDVTIYYQAMNEEYSQQTHPYWNEFNPTYRIFPATNKPGHNILQRDFSLYSNEAGDQAWAFGPFLDLDAIDTIDNIITVTLTRQLIKKGSLGLHAACVEKDDQAYIFFGASGAGKSTLADFCQKKLNLKILSGDQIYLHFEKEHLIATPCTNTIPDYPATHPMRVTTPLPIAGLIHLVQKDDGQFHFDQLSAPKFLAVFLRETLCWQDFNQAKELLNLASQIFNYPHILRGQMSYPLNYSFWNDLMSIKKSKEKNETRR